MCQCIATSMLNLVVVSFLVALSLLSTETEAAGNASAYYNSYYHQIYNLSAEEGTKNSTNSYGAPSSYNSMNSNITYGRGMSESVFDKNCKRNNNRCAGAPGFPFVQYEPCCDLNSECRMDAAVGWGYHCLPKLSDAAQCYASGARCFGETNQTYVSNYRCCNDQEECQEDRSMGYGGFCKPRKSCHASGQRCAGAPGYPLVNYVGCCDPNDSCLADSSLGWGHFCKNSGQPTPSTVSVTSTVQSVSTEFRPSSTFPAVGPTSTVAATLAGPAVTTESVVPASSTTASIGSTTRPPLMSMTTSLPLSITSGSSSTTNSFSSSLFTTTDAPTSTVRTTGSTSNSVTLPIANNSGTVPATISVTTTVSASSAAAVTTATSPLTSTSKLCLDGSTPNLNQQCPFFGDPPRVSVQVNDSAAWSLLATQYVNSIRRANGTHNVTDGPQGMLNNVVEYARTLGEVVNPTSSSSALILTHQVLGSALNAKVKCSLFVSGENIAFHQPAETSNLAWRCVEQWRLSTKGHYENMVNNAHQFTSFGVFVDSRIPPVSWCVQTFGNPCVGGSGFSTDKDLECSAIKGSTLNMSSQCL
jgi:hypothetical protein